MLCALALHFCWLSPTLPLFPHPLVMHPFILCHHTSRCARAHPNNIPILLCLCFSLELLAPSAISLRFLSLLPAFLYVPHTRTLHVPVSLCVCGHSWMFLFCALLLVSLS